MTDPLNSRPEASSELEPDEFELFDLTVTVEGGRFSLYAMAALLPLIPAKQRPTAAADWMTTDALIACPDPNCGARFRISRTGLRRFRHGECTVVPLPAKTGKHP